MGLDLGFLLNNLFFLLCSGTWYLDSSLVRVLTIHEMKFLSLLFMTESFGFFSTDLDNRGGVLDKAGAIELGTPGHGTGEVLGSNVSREAVTGVEIIIETSSGKEALENSSSEVHIVQLDIAKWYLLFSYTRVETSCFSLLI